VTNHRATRIRKNGYTKGEGEGLAWHGHALTGMPQFYRGGPENLTPEKNERFSSNGLGVDGRGGGVPSRLEASAGIQWATENTVLPRAA